jgi:O-antigen/teichoic acid export membrane protein
LSSIKKLAGQTMWYGLSSIAARFINYLLTPLLTYKLAHASDYGKNGLIYSALPILNIVFTYGFETTYFRFSSQQKNKTTLYNTAALSLLFTTIILTYILWLNRVSFANIVGLNDVQQIVNISIFIIALDALSTIPFAKLRQEERPVKFAFIKISSILINIIVTWFYIVYAPKHAQTISGSWILHIYNPQTNPIVYVVLANLIQSAITLVLLRKEILMIRLNFDFDLWKKMMIYSLPLIIVGMGGMVNETFDRLMLRWWLPGDVLLREEQVGVYNGCYKLSILITLFIQAFRMGAEPFFFKQAESGSPQKVYASVMKFFVIVICEMFLVVALYIPIWKFFIGPKYWDGLKVVPILLLANMFLGIYYNLTIWYKLGNKTIAGAWITIMGALITIVVNLIFIPKFGYMACAWATFLCYGSMMLICFIWGQKVYPIPYAWKKLVAYIVIVVLIFFIHKGITFFYHNTLFSLLLATILTGIYGWFILLVEKKEFQKLPVVGKYIK